MFKKVLISDDLGSINKGVLSVLKDLGVPEVEEVHYCDDAYLRIQKALLENDPYELLISDLSFKTDHRDQQFHSGEALIKTLKEKVPQLKVIVYSVEDRPLKLKKLINTLAVEGFVNKGRNGLKELKAAIESIHQGKTYHSPHLEGILNSKELLEFTDHDAYMLQLLSLGKSQEEISTTLKEKNLSPSSLSSVEKRLNKLRIQFKANNATHLVTITKDLGLI